LKELVFFTVVVTYNGIEFLKGCLEPVKQLNEKLIVVDNNSSDGTADTISRLYPSVTLIRNEENKGFGSAMNQGISVAYKNGADFVFLLNQDAMIRFEALENLVKIHNSASEYGILSPYQYGLGMNEFNRTFSNELNRYAELGNKKTLNLSGTIITMDFVNAATWLISRECIETVGGFDPSFFMYFEDADYAERVKAQGYRIGACQDVKSYHADKNSNKISSIQAHRNYINRWRFNAFWRKNGQNSNTYLLEILKRLTSSIIYLISCRMTYSGQNYLKFISLVKNLRWVFFRRKRIHLKEIHFIDN
jgi:GT2 family glycosyltransferase